MLLIHKLHLYLLCTKCCFSCLQFYIIQNRFLSSTAFILKLPKYSYSAGEMHIVGLMCLHLNQVCLMLHTGQLLLIILGHCEAYVLNGQNGTMKRQREDPVLW